MFDNLSYKLKVKQSYKTLTIDKKLELLYKLVDICVGRPIHCHLFYKFTEWAWLIFNTTMPTFCQSKQIH